MRRTSLAVRSLVLVAVVGLAAGCSDEGTPYFPYDAGGDGSGGGDDVAAGDADEGDAADVGDTDDVDAADVGDSEDTDHDVGEDTDAAVDTDDGDTCDDPSCLGPGECLSEAACQDGLFCNGTERCLLPDGETVGVCTDGTPPTVDDGVGCTIDACDEDIDAVTHTPDHDVCNDAAACNGLETCDVELDCVAGVPVADADEDEDGFSPADGDCDDCDPLVNPGAIELPDNDIDDNCDDTVDEPVTVCDDGLSLTDRDPLSAAAALDLCRTAASESDWGLVDASYVRANGVSFAPGAQVGLLDQFGASLIPQAGSSMVGLSTGYARDAGMAGACGSESCETVGAGVAPPGFPQAVSGCESATDINDDIALEVTLRAPTNVTGFRVSYVFISFEFPEWVCTPFNDQFIVLMSPPPPGAAGGNVAFDGFGNPISVNAAFVDHCDPDGMELHANYCPVTSFCPIPASPYCPRGDALMDGTGFNEWSGSYSGSTGWLRTRAPVTPGEEFTLRFAVWDAGDQTVDSTVLIDKFEWLVDDVFVATEPVPDP